MLYSSLFGVDDMLTVTVPVPLKLLALAGSSLTAPTVAAAASWAFTSAGEAPCGGSRPASAGELAAT